MRAPRQVYAVQRMHFHAGHAPCVQKARAQLQNHGLQFLCQSGSLFRTSATQSVAEDQTLICGHNRRRAYSQYIGFITPCIGIGSLFQQASNALCNEIGIASEPFLRIICSQHHHQCIQGRMAHHTGRKVGKAAQPFGDGVVKHRGTARQALLDHGPARPQQSLYTARISLCFPITAVPLRVVSIRV